MKIMHLKSGTGTGTWVDGSLAISQQSNTLHILFQFQRLSSKYNNNDICNDSPCISNIKNNDNHEKMNSNDLQEDCNDIYKEADCNDDNKDIKQNHQGFLIEPTQIVTVLC